MATVKAEGMSEVMAMLEVLPERAEGVIKKGVYEGAGYYDQKIREAISGLKGDTQKGWLSDVQVKGLLDGLYITKMKNDDGYINVTISFNGYNKVSTKKYPNGHPNLMIARATEGGAYWHEPHPFIKPILNKTKKEAIRLTSESIKSSIAEIVENGG